MLIPLEASFPLVVHIALGRLDASFCTGPPNPLTREEPRNNPGIAPEAGRLRRLRPESAHPEIQPINLGCRRNWSKNS